MNVLPILRARAAPAYAAIGTEGSTGTEAVLRVGPRRAARACTRCRSATTLARAAGRWPAACPTGTPLRAVLLGGAAGGFVGPDELDVPLTFEGTRAAGATLGSGVVMVLDDTVDLVPFLLRIAAFFRDESCGQCVPCRVGTVRQEEALHRLAAQRSRTAAGDLALLADVGQRACGTRRSAASARRRRTPSSRPSPAWGCSS